jgi:hypothetical protein
MKFAANELTCLRPMGIALTAIALNLAGCGDKPQPPVPQTESPKLFRQERETLDKANGVEQTEARHAGELRQQEEKQTQ